MTIQKPTPRSTVYLRLATPAERGAGFTVLEVLDSYTARPAGASFDRGVQHRAAFAATALASRPAEAFALEDLEGFIAKDFRYLKAACAYAKAMPAARSSSPGRAAPAPRTTSIPASPAKRRGS